MNRRSIIVLSCVVAVIGSPLLGEDVVIELPKVPIPPKVIVKGSTKEQKVLSRDRRERPVGIPLKKSAPPRAKEIVVEKKVPPKSFQKEAVQTVKKAPLATSKPSQAVAQKPKKKIIKSDAGEEKSGKISAYLRGNIGTIDKAVGALKSGGFEIVGRYQVDSGAITVILFTSKELKSYANRNGKEFMAVLRAMVDRSGNLSITNPLYLSKAYMKNQHNKTTAISILHKITSNFEGLKDSKDYLKSSKLPKYHFMFGMPYYEDMIKVGKADSSQELIDKIKSKKRLVSLVKLEDDRYIAGVKLTPKTEGFIDKIGTKNGLILPYPVIIEKGVAKILAPKYYIAVSYPLLKMSEFMKISDVPGEIEDEFEEIFK